TLIHGTGPFALLGEEVYDDYWMFYLTQDMVKAGERPYTNLKTYVEYKQRGTETLKAHAEEIATLAEEDSENEEAES
ncbi:MAG: restriction endonuclease, partial [Verrucomicrobia bacterium 12-59-8]